MGEKAEFWIPLVDEPIGDLVDRVHAEDAEVRALVASPRRQLAFRTFAYVRVGVRLGELLVDADVRPRGGQTWIEAVLADPAHYEAVADEVRAVAREVAADPELAADELGPDDAARERFRSFVRESLAGGENEAP